MKFHITLTACILTCLSIFSSCEQEQEKEVDISREETEELKLKADSLDHSVKSSWASLTQNQDQIFSDIKRLLDEISYTTNYDVESHEQLENELQEVQALQLDPSEVSDTSKVDEFDESLDELVSRVRELKKNTPGIESHPLADELVNDILENNSNKIIMLRVNYDDAVKQYNDFLLVNEELLDQLGKPYSEWEEKPTFMPSLES